MLTLFGKGGKDSPRLSMLQKLSLFATLTAGQLRVVNGLLHERRYLKGEIVFDEGEEGQALFVVISGRVLISRHGDPEPVKLAELGAGVIFGELALLDSASRAAQARAAEDCVLASLSRSDFESLLESHGAIASKIALQLARQLGRQLRQRDPAPAEKPS